MRLAPLPGFASHMIFLPQMLNNPSQTGLHGKAKKYIVILKRFSLIMSMSLEK